MFIYLFSGYLLSVYYVLSDGDLVVSNIDWWYKKKLNLDV